MIFYLYPLPVPIDIDHFLQGSDIDTISLFQPFRGGNEQIIAFFDFAPDVIW